VLRGVFSAFLFVPPLGAQPATSISAVSPPPSTTASNITTVLHGVSVVDAYQWLEDGTAQGTRSWIAAQQQYTSSLLTSRTGMSSLRKDTRELVDIEDVHRVLYRKGRYFLEKKLPEHEAANLYVRDGATGADRLLIDSGAPGDTVELLNVSADGQLLAYGIRHGGRDQLSIHFRDLSSDRDLEGDTLPEARYLYWSLPISCDRSTVYYVRFDNAGPRVYRHVFGYPVTEDSLIFGEDLGPEKLLAASLSPDGRFLLITVLHGASGATDLYLKDMSSALPAKVVIAGIDATFNGCVSNTMLYIQTDWKASHGHVFAVSVNNPARENWKVAVPEQPKHVIEAIALTSDRLIINAIHNAHSELFAYTPEGKPQSAIPLPGIGSVASLDADPNTPELCFSYSSFQTPNSFYAWHPTSDTASGSIQPISVPRVPARLQDVVVEQVWYPSRDGTRVPMFLAHRRDVKPDENLPVLLYGYGGFNWAQLPTFSPEEAVWLERGGVYAVANIRGGSEFGEAWHKAGELSAKQNSFDDFAYAAKWLMAHRYTRPERLAIQGLSNGGLLVTASITQHPELFTAAIGRYPLIDMVRYERFSIARWWVSEYGSVSDPSQFRTLYAYSPYHHVVKGTSYPAVLLITGDGDTRVDPSHARKMTAMLQNATSSGKPVLLLYDSKSGHSGTLSTAAEIEQTANELEFLDWQLHIPEVSR
jgi:prolyl oligopeptidase